MDLQYSGDETLLVSLFVKTFEDFKRRASD